MDANELIASIEKEKNEAISNGVLREEKKLEPIKPNDVPRILPDGWAWCRLGDYAMKVTDYVASGSFASLKENVLITNDENYAVMVKTADFSNDFTKNLTYTDEKGYHFLENSNLFGGELILSNIGSIGKVFIVPDLKRPMTLASNTVMVRMTHNEYNKYMYYMFKSPFGQGLLKSISSGTSMLKFNKTQLKSTIIPVAPLEVQKKICDVLDRVQRVIDERVLELEKLDELIKARFVELFGDPSLNTKGYPIKNLPEIAEYWNGLTYKPEDVADEGTIVLRSSNIQNAQLDFEDTVRVTCNIGEKKYVQDNDILMCSRNGSAKLVGKVALIKNIEEPMSFGAFMMIIRSQYYPYLMTFFQMPAFRAQITTGATTTINQITGRMLDNVKLPVPEKAELDSFISFIEQIDKSKVVTLKALAKSMGSLKYEGGY